MSYDKTNHIFEFWDKIAVQNITHVCHVTKSRDIRVFYFGRQKTGQGYVKKMIFKSWPFLPELDLTLGQMWERVSPSNSTSEMTHKACVIWHSCYIFKRWPHLTRSWPWPVLSISLLFTWHLRHPISSISAKFELAPVSGLVSAADKAKRVSFGLWPDLDPTFDLNKINRLH